MKRYETRTWWVEYDNKRIFGKLFVPRETSGGEPAPAVICSHFFGGTHRNSAEYAQAFAQAGFISYAFDFCGGSPASRSSGRTTEHSIKTEAADLKAILNAICALPIVDPRAVFLFGQSQGGAVSAMLAAECPDEVAGLVLCYPAFVIHEDMVQRFGSKDNVPESFSLWMKLGRIYATDAIDYDFAEHVGAYGGPVLIFQGDMDGIEPLECTQRVSRSYRDAKLVIVRGAGHGFYGDTQEKVIDEAVDFMRNNKG